MLQQEAQLQAQPTRPALLWESGRFSHQCCWGPARSAQSRPAWRGGAGCQGCTDGCRRGRPPATPSATSHTGSQAFQGCSFSGATLAARMHGDGAGGRQAPPARWLAVPAQLSQAGWQCSTRCCQQAGVRCGGRASHSASRRLPQHTTFVLAGFFSLRSNALRRGPPLRCVPKVVRYSTWSARSSARNSLPACSTSAAVLALLLACARCICSSSSSRSCGSTGRRQPQGPTLCARTGT